MVVVLGLRNAAPIRRHLGSWHPARKDYLVGETGQQNALVAPVLSDIHVRDTVARMRNELECREAAAVSVSDKQTPLCLNNTTNLPFGSTPWSPCVARHHSPSCQQAEQLSAYAAGPTKASCPEKRKQWQETAPQERVLKRRRPASDVDGPNTATLGCKKRRLRRHLITSRLSQPFSLPATHILNREAIAGGDKRLLKLAAMQAARRLNSTTQPYIPQHPSACSPLLRVATANQLCRRARMLSGDMGNISPAEMAANKALLEQVHNMGISIGGRFPAVTGLPHGFTESPHKMPLLKLPVLHQVHGMAKAASKTPGVLCNTQPGKASWPWQRPLHLRATPDEPPARQNSSQRGYDLDEDMDGEGMAFPGTEFDSKYDTSDDHDDVYADFGVLFGGSAEGEGPQEEMEHYEDYMDDLDGIPWHVR